MEASHGVPACETSPTRVRESYTLQKCRSYLHKKVFTMVRLQSYGAAHAHETVASAEQHRIAEAEHEFPAERLSSFGRIAEQELASLEALCVRVLQVGTRAQHHRQLDREEHGATQIAVQGI